MKYRQLGKTGLNVSEIGFGGEWLSRHPEEESVELIRYAGKRGINIIDCWMPDELSRRIIGKAIHDDRESWIVQGHLGSILRNGQSDKSRDLKDVIPAFENHLKVMDTPYIDIGMIFFMDSMTDWENAHKTGYMDYIREQKRIGRIRHIGMSTHNPRMGKLAAESGMVEMILFSVNPAFDMLPASENIDTIFADEFDAKLSGIDPDRAEFYKTCEEKGVGITVMKPFAGGRLFDAR